MAQESPRLDFIEPYLPPIASLQGQAQDDSIGLKCEIRHYELVKNAQGEKVLLKAGSSRAGLGARPRDHWSHSSALVLTKDFNDLDIPCLQLEIQSPYLKEALKKCVPEFEKFDINSKPIVLKDEPRCVFHYRRELISYHKRCASNDQHTEADHVRFLLDYMFNTLQSEVRHYNHFMENPILLPGLDFINLWMAFVPGQLVYVTSRSNYCLRRNCVFRLKSMTRCPCPMTWCFRYPWRLVMHSIVYDGTNFGYDDVEITIRGYEGVRVLQDLDVMPLEYHQRHKEIKKELAERGKKYVSLIGRHYKQSNGVAELLSDTRDLTSCGEDDHFPLRSTNVNGRIMVDYEAFEEARPSHSVYLLGTEKRFMVDSQQHLKMTEEEHMLCAAFVAGYSLQDKKWGWFPVESIRDIEFNTKAFDSLIFSETHKAMILALVKVHAKDNSTFDDVIQGKGKGLIMLLHGPPGTGKTLTAESIADHTEMPLLRMDAGSIGSASETIEESLAAIFRIAERWKAIILLDEADVFFEKRKTGDLERNRLVATFLRVLEYFEGVLFLTTNRINSFDPAIKSRIHLALHYPALDSHDRHRVWKTFLAGPGVNASAALLKDQNIDSISKTKLNGRQIKNTVHIANSLATSQGKELTHEHLLLVLDSMKSFHNFVDSNDVGEGNGSSEPDGCEKEMPRSRKRKRVEVSDSEGSRSVC